MSDQLFDFTSTDLIDFEITQVNITRSASSLSSGGFASKVAWTPVFSNINVSLQGLSAGSKTEIASKLQINASHVAYCDKLYALNNGDRLEAGADKYQITYWLDMGWGGSCFAMYLQKVES